jgi:hypothetical protein
VIHVKGSRFLNDIEIDNNGNIYTSDTAQSAIYYIDGKTRTSSLLINGLEGRQTVSTTRMAGSMWPLGRTDSILKTGPSRSRAVFTISRLATNRTTDRAARDRALDGVEEFSPNRWFISSNSEGELYLIDSEKGTKTLLIDNATNIADIGYDRVKKLLSMPLMKLNEVRIYTVEENNSGESPAQTDINCGTLYIPHRDCSSDDQGAGRIPRPALIPAAILLLIVYGLMKAKRWGWFPPSYRPLSPSCLRLCF